MFNPQFLDDNICYFTNALSEPDLLVKFIEESDSLTEAHDFIKPWVNWQAHGDTYSYGERKHVVAENKEILNPRALYIINSIHSGMMFCGNLYKQMKNIDGDVRISKNFVINKYKTTESMGQHVDWNEDNPNLRYSFVVYLNDNYEGGEIHFGKQNITLKPEAGSILIFPSNQPYEHGSQVVKTGNKYIVPHFWTK